MLTELPTYMKQVLRFSIKEVSYFSSMNVRVWIFLLLWLPFFTFATWHDRWQEASCGVKIYHFSTNMASTSQFLTHYYYFLSLSSLVQNGFLSALPYLAMWIFSNIISFVADWMIESGRFSHTITRKIINSIGQYGAAICLVIASYTGCNRYLTVAILTIGMGLNGGIYSGLCYI